MKKYFGLVLVAGLMVGCNRGGTADLPPGNESEGVVLVSEGSYTMDEVATHTSAEDCWMVISGRVYDVSMFVPDHPGGEEILKGCGKDATAMFNAEGEHQESNAAELLPPYEIGVLE